MKNLFFTKNRVLLLSKLAFAPWVELNSIIGISLYLKDQQDNNHLLLSLFYFVQFSSFAHSCQTLCDLMDCSTPGFPVHHQLLELTETHVHRVGDAIQPSHPLSSPSPPASIFLSIRVFSNDSVLHIRCPEYWTFSFSISPFYEYSGLTSFRMDWLDLLAVQGTLKSLPNTTVQKHQFFSAQLSLWSNSHVHT